AADLAGRAGGREAVVGLEVVLLGLLDVGDRDDAAAIERAHDRRAVEARAGDRVAAAGVELEEGERGARLNRRAVLLAALGAITGAEVLDLDRRRGRADVLDQDVGVEVEVLVVDDRAVDWRRPALEAA